MVGIIGYWSLIMIFGILIVVILRLNGIYKIKRYNKLRFPIALGLFHIGRVTLLVEKFTISLI